MIYFQNAAFGSEGLNTHVMAYTMCVSFSNFLDRQFYFDYEIPCSTPPAYALLPEFKDRFGILLSSERSLVSQLLDVPGRRVFDYEPEAGSKVAFQMLYSYFATTEAMKAKYDGSFVWNAFSIGRLPIIREELAAADLIEWTHTKISSPAVFYFLSPDEKADLLRSVELRYIEPLERLAADMIRQAGGFNAVHLRLGDFLTNKAVKGYSVNEDRFKRYVAATFPDRSIPILIATDGLHEKEAFSRIFEDYQYEFIDELVMGDFAADYRGLPFTDFNSLTVLNELICAAAGFFIGTYRSTFTGIIHRLRQERYGKRDFAFFPDEKVAKLLNDRMQIVPDQQGFFDWNRFSVFAVDHEAIAWMREWDHSRTAIGG